MSLTRQITTNEARRVARRFQVKLPRTGYEVSLGDGRWLSSTGHAQFGWFDKPAGTKPFSLTCRCDETLRRGEPRGCTADCPNKVPAK